MLQAEIDKGWLELFESDEAAEAKYGQIIYSRIGVVAKMKRRSAETPFDT